MDKHSGKEQRDEAKRQAKLDKYSERREAERERKGGGKHVRLGKDGRRDSKKDD